MTNIFDPPLPMQTLHNTTSLQIVLIAHASERAETKRDGRRMVVIKEQVSSANQNAPEPIGKTAPQTVARTDTRSLSTNAAGSKTWICLKHWGKDHVKVDMGLCCWKASKVSLGAGCLGVPHAPKLLEFCWMLHSTVCSCSPALRAS